MDYIIKSINEVQDYDGDFFKESLYMFYPQFDKAIVDCNDYKQRLDYMSPIIQDIYKDKKQELTDKTIAYQKYWDEHKDKIQLGLEKIFEIPLDYLFNDMEARVGLNPVCPRHLESSSFDAFYKFSPMGMAVTSIHEIIHFIWFYVWNKIFNDNIVEYENPHLKWILSEMVVDIIIDKAELNYLNPNNHETIYQYFHDIEIDGVEIIAELQTLLESNTIHDFMIKAYDLCIEHEDAIRIVMY